MSGVPSDSAASNWTPEPFSNVITKQTPFYDFDALSLGKCTEIESRFSIFQN